MQNLDIAVIGLCCRVPGAGNTEQLWDNLVHGREAVVTFTDEELRRAGVPERLLKNPNFVKAGMPLGDTDAFDASFFGLTPAEAQMLDRQQRMFLELSWEVVEQAGYDCQTYKRPIGVYAGMGALQDHSSLSANASSPRLSWIAREKDFLATLAAYKLNLKGPAISVQTSCSTSLVAVHLACQGLVTGDCALALAGGVSIVGAIQRGYLYEPDNVLSPDGHCRAFDARAEGTVRGEGAAVVLLKRLREAIADGDVIHAVIKGSAVNNDGSSKVGYVAPSVDGQAKVIRTAQLAAGVEADSISYVEAHGTATALGDPIEIAALTQAFRATTHRKGFCALGSIKTNIGHLGSAAGVIGLIKVILAMKYKQMPASLHFETPNPNIDFEGSPFFVNRHLRDWTAPRPLRAGVSSFGIGGTNVHVVLEEAPPQEASDGSRLCQLLILSAKTEGALQHASRNLAAYLKTYPDTNLADASYTLQVGRAAFPYRQISTCRTVEEAIASLDGVALGKLRRGTASEPKSGVVFLCPGQRSELVNVGLELYQSETAFQQVMDKCCETLKPILGIDLKAILYPNPNHSEEAVKYLQDLSYAQPALFALAYSLAQLFMRWGVKPAAVVGHSVGEFVAACIAGVMTMEDALYLLVHRGRLLQKMPVGGMLAIGLPEEQVRRCIGDEIFLAAVNAPDQCVVSGSLEEIEVLENNLTKDSVYHWRLPVARAGHSRMLDPLLAGFAAKVSQISLNEPRLPYFSGMTGKLVDAGELANANYWVQHVREPVRFGAAIREIMNGDYPGVYLEVGPGQTLSGLARLTRRDLGLAKVVTVISSMGPVEQEMGSLSFVMEAVGKLWLAGIPIDWKSFHLGSKRKRVSLPTYPFERQQFTASGIGQNKAGIAEEEKYPDGIDQSIQEQDLLTPCYPPANETERHVTQLLQNVLGITGICRNDNLVELGVHSLLAMEIMSQLRAIFNVKLRVADIYSYPDVASLSAYIASLLGEASSGQDSGSKPVADILKPASETENRPLPLSNATPIVRLRMSGAKPPLYLIHPISGDVHAYQEIINFLRKDRPVIALQNLDYNVAAGRCRSLEEWAVDYIEAISAGRPESPYYIGGWSMGAVLAFEMAAQLKMKGKEVRLLAMIDPPICDSALFSNGDQDISATRALIALAEHMMHAERKRSSLTRMDLEGLVWPEQLKSVLRYLQREEVLGTDISEAAFSCGVTAFSNNLWAVRHYRPKSQDGPVLFLKADERVQPANSPPKCEAGEWWKCFFKGPFIERDIPGNHFTMLRGNSLKIVADIVQRHLDDVDALDRKEFTRTVCV